MSGPPLEDYSATALTQPVTPLCIRTDDPTSEIKGYSKRVLEGNAIKFKRNDPEFPLLAFADEALNHMQTHGMDTVFYLKGEDVNGEGAEDLFTYHDKYTKSTVEKFITDSLDATNGCF